ncbi:NupC/NupG family nucleoside CNT transporter, partial [Klebsiella pneumoniae]|nr:NupC/NupG family nucleoside CNT transporter [Klebsiella pneumoniae]
MAALLTCEKNNMTAFFHFLLALAVILALAWLVSYDRQKIRIRYIIVWFIIDKELAVFLLHADSGLWRVKNIYGYFASV